MRSLEKELKKYYTGIRRELYCDTEAKKRILAAIKENVEAYLEEHPEATFENVQDRFGTPKQIATSYLEELEMPELIGKLKVRRTIVTAICTALGLVVLLWAVVVVIALIDSIQQSGGSGYSYITYID